MSAGIAIAWALLIVLGFYLLVVRPQRRRNLEHQALVRSLEVGDEVVTVGGIVGHITEVDRQQNLLEVEIAPGTRVTVLRDAVARKVVHHHPGDADTSPGTPPGGTDPD